ncbi:MAG: hypothetical protein PHW65_04230 [Dehalococcoidales bacterium]|nr:hypothetical protein [Dehalococcoidales bacterium]
MAKREDEFWRENYYGGHPPACTCVKCTEKRLAGLKATQNTETIWLFILMGAAVLSAGWLIYLAARSLLDARLGMLFIAGNLGVFIWTLTNFASPWPRSRSLILSLVIILLTIVVTAAVW